MAGLDFDGLARQLLASAETHLASWLPAGRKRGNSWVAGDLSGAAGQSLKVNITTGAWADFATGDHGSDLVSLYAAIYSLPMGEAYRELGGETKPATRINGHHAKPQAQQEPTRRVVTPVPEACADCPCTHPRYGPPAARWTYFDGNGEVLGYVARYEPAGERKQIVPWTWDGERWGMGQWPSPRPLYGLQELEARPDSAVLVVEGEKAADAARRFATPYVVITWPAGAMATDKADWTPLTGRKVLLWPDADEPGKKAMQRVAQIIHERASEVKVLEVSDQPDGWDAADAEFTGWADCKAWMTSRVSVWAPSASVPVVQRAAEVIDADTGEITDISAPLPDEYRGRALSTIENLAEICRRLGVTVRYNVISKEEEIMIPEQSFSLDNRGNASIAWLMSWCERLRMPTGKVGDYITYMADRNLHNPVANWIESKPWDGQSRLQDLYDTVASHGDEDLKNTIMRRWLISAVAAAFNPTGVSAHGVLVFQGAQYMGKTAWFKRLVPKELGVVQDGMMLRPDDRDSVKQVVSHWLVELGELDATFRKSDIAQLKAFLTRDKDILRRAYARKESEFARRTVFFASVNPKEFLHDQTGNRRFWVIECKSIDYDHGIDMQQLWAEVLTMYRAGEGWTLHGEEHEALEEHNKTYEVIDPIEELIASGLRWNEPPAAWRWRSATEVLAELGRDTCTQGEATRAAHLIRQRNGNLSRKANGARALLAPEAWGNRNRP
jgi:hypothetical protein